ncbi:MAG: hypothetical protein JW395_0518 [Nitrospira sp.]|jgi:hypothetical protein|nr:hypothetical protein [Nitrospira sp.]
MKTPKQLFHREENKADVRWLAGIIDDPRFEQVLLMVEANLHGNMANITGPNQMMIDNAIRIGMHRFRTELLHFASPASKPQQWAMPPVLHDPDRPATT